MANMLRRICNRGCCENIIGGANPKPKERREWQRDYMAGEYMTDEHESRWYEKRKRLAEESEATSYRGREN